jgi:hypothetical protein
MTAPHLTLGQGLTIGKGITFGAGTSGPSLTITSTDFNSGRTTGALSNDPTFGINGTEGYQQTFTGRNLVDPFYQLYNPIGSISTTITNFFTTCGYDIAHAYVFHASFASGTVLVRASYDNGYFNMIVIDQTNTNWQSGDPYTSLSLMGTFMLPVTLTPYTPATQLGNIGEWC